MKTSMKKRVLALALAALMIVGLVPTGFAAKEVKGASTTYVHVLDAADFTSATETVPTGTMGTEGFFSFADNKDKVKVIGVNEHSVKTVGDKTYSYLLQVNGKFDKSNQRGVVFTTKRAAKVTVVVATKGGAANKVSIGKYEKGVKPVALEEKVMEAATADGIYPVGTFTFELAEAGTYILGSSDNGCNIYSVVVDETPIKTYEMDAADFTSSTEKVPTGTMGTEGFFSFADNKDKVKVIEVNEHSVKTVGDKTYAYLLQVNGKFDKSNQRGVVFTTKGKSTVTVVAATKGGAANKVSIGKYVKGVKPVALEEKTMEAATVDGIYPVSTFTFELAEAGTYIIGSSDNGCNIYSIKVDAEVPLGASAPTGLTIAGAQSTTNPTTVELTLGATNVGEEGSKYAVYRQEGDTEPILLDKITKGNQASVSYVDTTLKASGTYKYIVKAIGMNDQSEEVPTEESASVDVVFNYTWDMVAAPTLSEVTKDGNALKVTLKAAINELSADYAYVTMYHNGFEVSTVKVTDDALAGTEVSFSPKEDGDYTFQAFMCKAGCPDKKSDVKTFTGFIKPIDTPTITWLDNLGNGSVYVDWNNVACDSFKVEYKVVGDADYTTATAGTTAGNLTLTGLTAGSEYEVKVTAKKAGFEDVSSTAKITVGAPVQIWNTVAVGSATDGVISINGGSKTDVKTGAPVSAVDITNANAGTIQFDSVANGKIADSEDGFIYYYTKINPNTENFKITATFEVIDGSAADNQSAFGIFVTDILGYGTKDDKYFNSLSIMNGKFNKYSYHANGARQVTGYTSYDTSDNNGVTRFYSSNVPEALYATQNVEDKLVDGQKLTFTVEKTNTGFALTLNGETKVFEGVSSLMQQEDGSINVGVMAARKVTVKVSDIKFEKTAGSVDSTDGPAETLITPAFNVYSSKNIGTKEYTFIGAANCAGSLTVTANGKVIGRTTVGADKIVKLPVTLWNVGGTNTIEYSFAPNSATNIANTDVVSGNIGVKYGVIGEAKETIYVSPTGKWTNKGTKESPLDLQNALNYAHAGNTIVMLDGTYFPTQDYVIGRSQNGTEANPITLVAENPGKVVIDGSKLVSSNGALTIVGSYWHVYGIDVINSPGKGVSVCGNDNIVEMCNFIANGNSGLQISRYAGEPNDGDMWPARNLIKNCTSYDNCDAGRNDADGFAAKLTCGEGNVFYGCISHHNIDDGWDLYAKSTTGCIGAVTIENCIAYSNGWLTTEDPAVVGYGEGNGFKLGGENMFGAHKLINSIAYNNAGKGITSNSGPDCEIYNCTSYNNSLKGKAYNISLYTKASNPKAWVVEGVLSVCTNTTTAAELGASNGIIYSLKSESNYLYDGTASYNTLGDVALESWFKNVDVTVAPTRRADGTIDMHELLEIVEAPTGGVVALADTTYCPATTGARLDVTSARAISVMPVISNVVVNSSNIPTGDSTPIMFMLVLLAVSALTFGAMFIVDKKKKTAR